MADSDDDAPPPLSSLADQLEALRLHNEGVPSTDGPTATAGLAVASAVLVASKIQPALKAVAIRKGFFNAQPRPRAPAPKTKTTAGVEVEEIIDLRGVKKQPAEAGKRIPDFMMLPPDEQATKYAIYKEQLVDALKPTPDSVDQIAKDPTLLAGFDDPEVMRAVNDIAANPQNFKKYQKNQKVMLFYSSMGKIMGEQLDKLGPAAPVKPT